MNEHHEEIDEHHATDGNHAHIEAPAEFRDMTNPLAGDAAAIVAGQEIY